MFSSVNDVKLMISTVDGEVMQVHHHLNVKESVLVYSQVKFLMHIGKCQQVKVPDVHQELLTKNS